MLKYLTLPTNFGADPSNLGETNITILLGPLEAGFFNCLHFFRTAKSGNFIKKATLKKLEKL